MLSDEIINHQRRAQNILEVLAQIGGIAKLTIALSNLIGRSVSTEKFYERLIEKLYFSKSKGPIKFRTTDAFFGKKKKLFKKGKKIVRE